MSGRDQHCCFVSIKMSKLVSLSWICLKGDLENYSKLQTVQLYDEKTKCEK